MSGSELSQGDLVELTQLVTEFAWLVDHRKSDQVPELFVEEGEIHGITPEPMVGRAAIKVWADNRTGVDYATRHVCSNMYFVATGEDEAEGTTVLTVYLHRGEGVGEPDAMSVADYHDTFVKRDGRWRMRSRRTEPIFKRSAG